MNLLKGIITLIWMVFAINSLSLCPVTIPVMNPLEDRIQVIVTAYSSTIDQTDSTPFITASGKRVRLGIIAVSRDLLEVLNFGQVVYLENIGYFVVEDIMNARWTKRVDIWLPNRFQALNFGVQKSILRWDKRIISLMGFE